ncbi:amidase family protein, partial [Aestuariivirga sp.]|uniref:amidase family protein n=1 Tax=Aestuariivirga sp. TaxID=2650926 RepID=UPI0025BC3469
VSRDLGLPPVDGQVADLVLAAARKLEAEGVIVEEAHPDLRETRDCAQTLRALSYANMAPLLDKHRGLLKPEVVWNIEKGLKITGAEIARAEAQRGEMFRRMRAFFETYDLLLCPATIVPPFPVEQRYVTECGGVTFDTYVDWLMIVHAITLTASPAISIPCGFTADRLPVGLQVVAPGRGEEKLLAGARFIEQVLGLGAITPIDPRT